MAISFPPPERRRTAPQVLLRLCALVLNEDGVDLRGVGPAEESTASGIAVHGAFGRDGAAIAFACRWARERDDGTELDLRSARARVPGPPWSSGEPDGAAG
ncbi:hypothetical protein [Umezawaea beigongshangensis]|uniref:hypothetical protein n=1 Tax=Umezawaea beigongshangensis TaxID=2780383 RepID=UPI0018F20911|nr:hypothetical protein [Umezawaea beigongshangensis]